MNVVVDANHTTLVMVETWRPVAARTGARVRIVQIDVPLHVALDRNGRRARQVTEGVIRRQAAELAKGLPSARWYVVLHVADLEEDAIRQDPRPRRQARRYRQRAQLL